MNSSRMPASPTICLVGGGNMGGAMLGGWLAGGYEAEIITVIDPGPPDDIVSLIDGHGVRHLTSAHGAAAPDILIVAVKPQIIASVLGELVHLMNSHNVLVSVAAGTTLAQLGAPFSGVVGAPVRVVRTIPNTPSLVNRGMTVCVAGEGVSDDQCREVAALLEAIGDVAWVEDEALIDVATGVSGSGPAYVFHLAEALADAGVAAGLPAELADKLARATVSGAGELIRQSDLPAAQLRENVTSPNGTTAAALEILMGGNGFPKLLKEAVLAAANRSRELAG